VTATGRPRRVSLVGAGHISGAHAQALRTMEGVEVVAVCDPDRERADRLAGECGVTRVFGSVEDLVGSGCAEYAHVLVPPDLHAPVADELLAGDLGVFVEKPMGVSSRECEALLERARERDRPVGANHNALFYPAYLRLREAVRTHAIGPLQHLSLILNYPARSIPPPAHWMFRRPENLFYESGVHPCSQIFDLAGPVVSSQSQVAGRRELPGGGHFYDTWQVSFTCERATAHLFLSWGSEHATWQITALGQDGVATADVERNLFGTVSKTRWPVYYEPLHLAARAAAGDLAQGLDNVRRGALSVIRPQPKKDVYSVGMRASISAFHRGPAPGQPVVDGEFAAYVTRMCDAVTEPVAAEGAAPEPARRRRPRRRVRPETVVLGGTGFIGRHLAEALTARGQAVRVVARSTTGLPPAFDAPGVELVAGDVTDPESVRRALEGMRSVVHLAHGGQLRWDAVQWSMIDPAANVADLCLEGGVERLVYAGSIASLYLGDPREVITGATPNDPQARSRGHYSYGKAESEAVLQRRFERDGLPLCIVRPGVVLGEGGNPFHSGFGIWRGHVHCVGWNRGTNPLPLVLVADVAEAIALALDPGRPAGRAYNLVGDVRLTARECVAELRRALERPLEFHPRAPAQIHGAQAARWAGRTLSGRKSPFPSYRQVKSMGTVARFDCSDVKRDLGWAPCADRERFARDALRVHGRRVGD
jgi:predicted dehydrogenase/nucleoside-diphosphate-sugar epimerase